MTITPLMEALERVHGKSIKELLISLYAETGDIGQVGEALGITRATVWTWRLRLGISDADLFTARALKLEALKQKAQN